MADVDQLAGPRNRSRFVKDAVRRAVTRAQLRLEWARTSGVLSAEDYPHWRTSDDVVKWVREMRAEETDPGDAP